MQTIKDDAISCPRTTIFNTYGPRLQNDDGRVISKFMIQALMDQEHSETPIDWRP